MSAIPGYEGPAHPLSSLIEALTMLGYPKIRMKPPNKSSRKVKTFKYTDDAGGDRETKGLLHSKNTPRTQGIFLV
jgi:hypothetical protein